MDDVRVLADAAAVEAALDPIRAAILDALTEPGSATTVAAAVGSTRQKVNYHLKALETHGLVELAEERAWGGITERFVRRSARHLVVAPDVIGRAALDPNEVADRLSAAYLIAVNARTDAHRRHRDRVQLARRSGGVRRRPPISGRRAGRPLPPRRRATAPSDR